MKTEIYDDLFLTLFRMAGNKSNQFSLCKLNKFKAIPSASLKLLNLKQKHSSKKLFFLVKLLTSFIKTLGLTNVGHMTWSIIWFESRDNFLMMSWIEIMTSKPSFQNVFILRKHRVANFVNIIKIPVTFIKLTFKDSKKLKEL